MNVIDPVVEQHQPRTPERIPSPEHCDGNRIDVDHQANTSSDPVNGTEGAVAVVMLEAAVLNANDVNCLGVGVFDAIRGMIDDDDDEVPVHDVSRPLPPSLPRSTAINHIDSCSSTSSQPCSGVRRKSYTITSPLSAFSRFPTASSSHHHSPSDGHHSPSGSTGGAKRKIRPNSDAQDYFAIWTAHSPSPSAADLCDVSAFLSVSTPKHRPLERSWPPRDDHQFSSQRRPAEQPFSFELIDTDEPNAFGDAEDEHIDFIPGEFFAERRHAGDGQVHGATVARKCGIDENAPLATPETDGSMSVEGLPLRTTGATPKHHQHQHQPYPELLMASCSKLKPLLKKKIGPDNYINTIMTTNMVPTNYNFPCDDSLMGGMSYNNHSRHSPVDEADLHRCTLKGEFIPLKPHKPLSRQVSGGTSPKYFPIDPRPNDATEGTEHHRRLSMGRKPLPLSPRPRSPPSGSSTRSASPLDVQLSREIHCINVAHSLINCFIFQGTHNACPRRPMVLHPLLPHRPTLFRSNLWRDHNHVCSPESAAHN